MCGGGIISTYYRLSEELAIERLSCSHSLFSVHIFTCDLLSSLIHSMLPDVSEGQFPHVSNRNGHSVCYQVNWGITNVLGL